MLTGKQYAEAAVEVYNRKPKVGYIWGTRFILWTKARQEALVKKYNSDPEKYKDYKLGAQIGSKWIGHTVTDCSGLTSGLAEQLGLKGFHHGSNSSWRYDCAYKGEKKKGMRLPAGAWMYTGTKDSHGHIGIVDPTGEWVVEAQGTKNGVTRTKVSDSKWTYWGLGKNMEFDFIPGQESMPAEPAKESEKQQQATTDVKPEPAAKTYPTLRRGARGENVRLLQELLAKDGSTLQIDGIFGPGTQSAVRAFQKKYGLKIDGIVGPQTWKKLRELHG